MKATLKKTLAATAFAAVSVTALVGCGESDPADAYMGPWEYRNNADIQMILDKDSITRIGPEGEKEVQEFSGGVKLREGEKTELHYMEEDSNGYRIEVLGPDELKVWRNRYFQRPADY